MKELKIGEEIRIRCVEDIRDISVDNCRKCVLHPCGGFIKECSADYRTDNKDVHFELVEDKQ